MSQPSQTIERALHRNPAAAYHPELIGPDQPGLHGIKGLNFSYRLNQWGPKTGPTAMPANAFPNAYVPQGLSGPLTWLESLVGLESAEDMVKDASDSLEETASEISPLSSRIQTLLVQAQNYEHATDASVQAKSQAAQAQGAGLTAALSNFQSSYATLLTQVSLAANDASISKDAAKALKDKAALLEKQVSDLSDSVDDFDSNVQDLIKYAQSGPSVTQSLENTAAKSVNTLTWLVGGGALVYFLAPTFIPRMASGIRKAARG